MEEWREAEQQLLRDIGYIDKSDAVDRTPYLKKEEERLKALQEDLQATADEVSHKEL
jgi:membrane-bound lytic murein transglycosylase MltF